jgi:hypothetical protein
MYCRHIQHRLGVLVWKQIQVSESFSIDLAAISNLDPNRSPEFGIIYNGLEILTAVDVTARIK